MYVSVDNEFPNGAFARADNWSACRVSSEFRVFCSTSPKYFIWTAVPSPRCASFKILEIRAMFAGLRSTRVRRSYFGYRLSKRLKSKVSELCIEGLLSIYTESLERLILRFFRFSWNYWVVWFWDRKGVKRENWLFNWKKTRLFDIRENVE